MGTTSFSAVLLLYNLEVYSVLPIPYSALYAALGWRLPYVFSLPSLFTEVLQPPLRVKRQLGI